MKKELQNFLNVIKCGIYDNTPPLMTIGELQELRDISNKNNLNVFFCDVLGKNHKQDVEINTFMAEWKKESIMYIIAHRKKMYKLNQLIQAFDKNNITYAIFKGMILADMYPNPNVRYSSDADILVDENDFDRAQQILRKLQFAKDELHSKECVANYIKENLLIELHKRLWEDYEGSQIELIKSLRWDDCKTFRKVMIEDYEYTTLGYLEHLEFIIFHMVKHFVYSGFGMRHLMDLVIYVNNCIDNIDCVRFWQDMENLGFSKFCEAAFDVGIRYLNMDSTILDVRKKISDEFAEEFITMIVNSGTFGDKMVRTSSLDNYFDDAKQIGKKYEFIFPSLKEMKGRYSVLNKFPFLLPFCWMMRWGYFISHPKLIVEKRLHKVANRDKEEIMNELKL